MTSPDRDPLHTTDDADRRALADRRATECNYLTGLCACPGGTFAYWGCIARREHPARPPAGAS